MFQFNDSNQFLGRKKNQILGTKNLILRTKK